MTQFSVPSFSRKSSRAYCAVLVAAIALLLPNVGAAQTYVSPGDQVQYPGAPGPPDKVETAIGPVKFRPYGTILLNVQASDTITEDTPVWGRPDSTLVTFPDGTRRRSGEIHDLIFSARQTVLGLNLTPATPSSGWSPSALVEFDFFGSRPVDNRQPQARVLNEPRLRFAYMQIEKGSWKVTAGQDRAILAPLDPISLSHVAIPLGATAGDLWAWLPQVRADHTHKFGETTALLQFGVLRPQFGDFALNDQPIPNTIVDQNFNGLGERSTQPFYQARLALSHPILGSTATVGMAGHYGREAIGSNRDIDSWAFAVDFHVPLHSRLALRGEGFVGSNLIPFQGGVLQGVAVVLPQGTQPGVFQKIGAGGGWGELTIFPTADKKNIFYLGAGTDDPRDADLLPSSNRAKNTFYWASYFRQVADRVTIAAEWSNWQYRLEGFVNGRPGPRGNYGSANVFNVSLAYQF
jgi:hypothetical protein